MKPLNSPRRPPYKLATLALTAILAIVLIFVYHQFRGDLTPKTRLPLVAPRAGLSFTSPKNPAPQRITPARQIQAAGVSTEFNTLFETVMSIAEKVDPIKLNDTLTATAQALEGLGDSFGQSIANGNEILNDLNQRMPQLRDDTQKLADLADV
jgi:phospholipid/cholesterol/gamma-HCH transport system substrate-binding protein